MDQAKKEQISKDLEKLPELEQNDIISIEDSYIQELTEKYINSLDDPQELKTDIGLFKCLLLYLKDNYIKEYLSQYRKYDIKVLDNVFNIYIQLAYKYKKNKQPNILEFTLLCDIDNQYISDMVRGIIKNVSSEYILIIQKWLKTCENALQESETVKSMFLLKTCYGYVEQTAAQPIIHAQNVLNVGSLPDLKDIMLTDGKQLQIPTNKKL